MAERACPECGAPMNQRTQWATCEPCRLMKLCIHCEARPIWKPYSAYVCEECWEYLGRAQEQCPCPCHATNPYPTTCCSDRHIHACADHID